MNTVTTGPDSTMFVHVSGGCGIRDGMLATLKAEIHERQDIVNVLEAANFERFKAMHAKMAAKAMDNDLQVGEQQLYGELPRPVHGDAIAKVRGKTKPLSSFPKDWTLNDLVDDADRKGQRVNLVVKKRKGKRHRRTPEDIEAMASEILEQVKAYPGQRAEQIAEAIETDTKTMRKPMLALIAAKRIGTKGQRRGMTYFPKGRAK